MSIVFFRLYRKNQCIGATNAELVKEQNHRVKNNLQIVSSLLSLQANRLTDESAKNAVAEGQLRVEAMAILHRQLYDGDQLAMINPAEFIPELVDMVLQTFGYTHVRLVYDIDAFVLPADSALPVSLILNELTTNACKYAFPDHPDPVFHVSCRQKKNQIDLLVADNGPGMLPQFPIDARSTSSTSFGMRLIQMQVDQLRGMYTFAKQTGTVFTLTFTV
ncbi:sensor histidine kinase [Spirosoma flavum]|uniref:histidine kinase n=1 Tax=Spirosoma flavum TaxID=2048557 RepID=A0ABW6AMB6_9BACT